MTNKNFIKLISLTLFIFYSCSTRIDNRVNSSQEYLDEFIDTFPVLSSYRWKVYSESVDDNNREITLELEAKKGDTTIVVSLEKYLAIENNMLSNCYTIARFIKTYKERGLIHDIYTIGGDSILFHYYYNEETPKKRYIVEGKYRYMEYFGADSSQIFTPSSSFER